MARLSPSRTADIWRWHPLAWNEVIYLPLPFAGNLLALLVQQNREEGFRQITFVAAERPLQRRAVLAALEYVALDDLRVQSLAEMANVAERLKWTTDAPAELPAELMAALPRFDWAAQRVGQYLALHSPFRKGEALQSAVAEVESLQRSLIATRGRAALRLLQIANEWRQLLEAEQAQLRAQVEAAQEIPNPFVFGNPVAETEQNVFTGRRDIVRQIEASILGAGQAPTLLLHGPRRMGKSSVLNQLPRLLGPDFAPATIDCQSAAVRGSAATLLRYLSRALSHGLRRKRVAVEPLTAGQLEREPFAVFDDWLHGVERAMPGGMRALLCLDEYERLQAALQAGWGADFLDTLRHILQHCPRVVLMFTGAHTFAELGPAWTDRFISARRVRISFLRRDEVEPLLTRPIPEFDLTYEPPDAWQAIFEATHGQPFLTQAVAFELVQFINEEKRKTATRGDIETAIARALDSGGEYFANVWSDAGEQGQAILLAVASGATPPDFPTALTWLCEHDVLDQNNEFLVPMVERWVRTQLAR
ncbi:MAG: ATP-binding protein [Armatimonadota bacterium]|nr:ATP-binding protein [Armatimonadota bacterium]